MACPPPTSWRCPQQKCTGPSPGRYTPRHIRSTAGPTLKLASNFYVVGRAKLQHLSAYMLYFFGFCRQISVRNHAKKAVVALKFLVGMVAGPADSGAEVGQQGGALPRQADCAPQGQAWPARRRAPRPRAAVLVKRSSGLSSWIHPKVADAAVTRQLTLHSRVCVCSCLRQQVPICCFMPAQVLTLCLG